MSGYFLMAVIVVILSLLAHGAKKAPPCDTILRIIYCSLAFMMVGMSFGEASEQLTLSDPSLKIAAVICVLILFKPVRALLTPVLTIINQLVMGRPILAAMGKLDRNNLKPEIGCGSTSGGASLPFERLGVLRSFCAEKIFQAESIPHLNGLWFYVAMLGLCISEVRTAGLKVPNLVHLPVMTAIPEDYFGMFCGVAMALFGVGFVVTRKFPQVLLRLGLVKPTWKHVAIAFFVALLTFGYDYLWSLYTHSSQASGLYPSVMAKFNEGTYLADGNPSNAFWKALATGVTAGVEEEILFRGAIQPVLGAAPSAFLHALMHQQFSGAPLYMLQIFLWSTMMGIVKRYSNTTTTMMAHAMFNFLQVFMIGFNP